METVFKCSEINEKHGNITILSDINLAIAKNRVVGLFGPNGSGKSTFLKIAAGINRPSHGNVKVCGQTINHKTKKFISYLPSYIFLDTTKCVCDILKYYKDFFIDFNIGKTTELLEKFKINTKERLSEMSQGTLEILQVIIGISRNADLYIFDEPLQSVATSSREYILNNMIKGCGSFIIASQSIHDMENIVDDIIIMNKGTIIYASSANFLKKEMNNSLENIFKEVFFEC